MGSVGQWKKALGLGSLMKHLSSSFDNLLYPKTVWFDSIIVFLIIIQLVKSI